MYNYENYLQYEIFRLLFKQIIVYQWFLNFDDYVWGILWVRKIIKDNDNAYHIRGKQHANSNTAIGKFWIEL